MKSYVNVNILEGACAFEITFERHDGFGGVHNLRHRWVKERLQ